MLRMRCSFGSLDAAIFLYSRVSRIPDQCRVLPAISTNDHLMLAYARTRGLVDPLEQTTD